MRGAAERHHVDAVPAGEGVGRVWQQAGHGAKGGGEERETEERDREGERERESPV